jgi:probable rRNA maturation factor
MVDLVFNNSTSDTQFGESFFKDILNIAAEDLHIKETAEVSVNLVGPAKIKSLNLKYRNKDKETDVLSFPLEDDSLKKYGIMPLGDIFICPAYVEKKIKATGESLDKTMAHLAVHGFLHLLGYDHETSEADAEKMSLQEQKILTKFLKSHT